jgi:beta-lactamase class D
MSRAATKRSINIVNHFDNTKKGWANVTAQFNSSVNEAVQLTAWIHDNVLNNKGDISNEDRQEDRVEFLEKLTYLKELISKLDDCHAVYSEDLQVYQDNYSSFVAKYGINIQEVDSKFK